MASKAKLLELFDQPIKKKTAIGFSENQGQQGRGRGGSGEDFGREGRNGRNGKELAKKGRGKKFMGGSE